MGTLINVTTGEILARNVLRAELWHRLVGFLPRSKIPPDDGLWFDKCATIHTIGMRRRIDVIFLDGSSRVLRIERSVRRFRLAVACPGGRAVVELGEAPLGERDLLVGDQLALQAD